MGNPVEIVSGIYLGSVLYLNNKSFIESKNIKYVISIMNYYPNPKYANDHYFIEISDYGISKEGKLFQDHLSDCFQWIENKLKKNDGNIFIHCKYGVNRSPSLLISYIMWKYNTCYDFAKRFVLNKRPIISPFNALKLQTLNYFGEKQCNKIII
jgi:protein-tyrosine phosphatase